MAVFDFKWERQMRKMLKRLRWGGIILLVAGLFVLPALSLAQEGDQDGGTEGDGEVQDEPFSCDSPVAQSLAEQLGVPCEELAASGAGLGEIMKAWHLSQSLPGFEDDWQGLLDKKLSGLGWGQLKMASRLSGGDPEAIDVLLAYRQQEIGWGQIRHAQAIAAAAEAGELGEGVSLSVDEIIVMYQEGKGWGDIRTELGLDPGPPPWAGGGKDKAEKGQPAWANGGQDKEANGPPPWANNDKDKDKGGANGNGQAEDGG
jgi:hypothetical protein